MQTQETLLPQLLLPRRPAELKRRLTMTPPPRQHTKQPPRLPLQQLMRLPKRLRRQRQQRQQRRRKQQLIKPPKILKKPLSKLLLKLLLPLLQQSLGPC
jgi:hypothetical protein